MAQSLPPASILERIRRNEQRIADAGLTVEHRGGAWHVYGRGVDLLLAGLENLAPADLVPVRYQDFPG